VSESEKVTSLTLDPVVHAAMRHLTSWVYPPLRQRIRYFTHNNRRWERNLKNSSNRAATIHVFKHLKYHKYSFQPDQLQAWALAHGWKAFDAQELHDYAEGVLAGKRYHTDPDPFGMDAIEDWRADAAASKDVGPRS
jgi:hypothetical protein